jgi:DNA-binding FadR family transcriptional regulator
MLEIHKEHELIVAAIGKKDPELARKACRYHVILAAKRQQIDIDWPV